MKRAFVPGAHIILFVLFLAIRTAGANTEPMRLDERRWRDMTEDVNYSENYKDRKAEPAKPKESEQTKSVLGGFKYVFYALLMGGIIFLAVRLINSMLENPDVKPTVEAEIRSFDEGEEDIHETDLEAILEQALKAGDFRLAIRMNFLILIRLLSEKGKIAWTKEKTNWEYYAELREKLLADQFKNIVQDFERCWYGEIAPDEQLYRRSIPIYEDMQNKLRA